MENYFNKLCDLKETASAEFKSEIFCGNGKGIPEFSLHLPFFRFQKKDLPEELGIGFVWFSEGFFNVGAVMEDSFVFNDAAPENDQPWMKGDVLELFIMPDYKKGEYYELHIAPNASKLQLKIPDAAKLKAGKYEFENLICDTGMTANFAEFEYKFLSGWWATVSVPLKSLGMENVQELDTRFVLCRYNYKQRGGEPELSSIAQFTESSFHTPNEWIKIKNKAMEEAK